MPKLTVKQIEALDLVDTLCNNEEFCFDIKLRPGDMEVIIANNTKLKKLIKWQPKYNKLSTIVKSCIEWEKKF